MKGTYILLIFIKRGVQIRIGALGKIYFKRGYYCYIGSAFGKTITIEKRVGRHLKRDKKSKWHIDYLLKNKNVKIIDVITFPNKKIECKIAKNFSKYFKGVKNFGCSDCKCNTHLYQVCKNF
ncbi:MAG: GIY-YIG nuclease family protein [Candidatus Aenigmarchaeota archaeon]|nr:GIY-YIG nuclease family protein [Candidatus Aenigmarchaeota archaeon]